MAQKGPLSATLTNPASQTFKFNPKQKIPPLAFNCLTSDGKPRVYFCEFAIVEMEVVGKNGVSLAKISSSATTTPVKLNKSQAASNNELPGGGALNYLLKLRYRRIAKPAFPTTAYAIGTAVVDNPSTASEVQVIHTFADAAGKLPGPLQEHSFIVVVPYSGGSLPTLNGGIIKYIQIANPATFDKVKSPKNSLSDRAEAAISFQLSVDFSK